MHRADLVLEGGGVRGLGAAGAVIRLLEEDCTFPRAAGTSVGAIAAAFVAAGVGAKQLRGIVERLDLTRVPDSSPPGVPLLSEGISMLGMRGAYQGEWIREWLRDEVAEAGVTTFADLRTDDPDASPTWPGAARTSWWCRRPTSRTAGCCGCRGTTTSTTWTRTSSRWRTQCAARCR